MSGADRWMNPVPMNPIPGIPYGASSNSSPVDRTAFAFLRWAKALGQRDSAEAARTGTELLNIIAQPAPSLTTELFKAMQEAVHALQAPSSTNAAAADDAGIDWYSPDPDRFYVLDKQSGVQLEAVLDDLRHAHRYIARGARAPNRLLFIGQPGTGKTAGALWLGSQLGQDVALVRIDATVQSSVGGTAKTVRAYFEMAQDRGAILVLDEFEAIAVPRNNTSANVGQWSRETTGAILQLLDSLKPDQIVIGATNLLDQVDAAVQRRMRKHVYFGMPDRDARAAMLKQWWKLAPHEGHAKKVLLDFTEGYSGDVLERASEEANRRAARRAADAPITVADVMYGVGVVIGAGETPAVDAPSVTP